MAVASRLLSSRSRRWTITFLIHFFYDVAEPNNEPMNESSITKNRGSGSSTSSSSENSRGKGRDSNLMLTAENLMLSNRQSANMSNCSSGSGSDNNGSGSAGGGTTSSSSGNPAAVTQNSSSNNSSSNNSSGNNSSSHAASSGSGDDRSSSNNSGAGSGSGGDNNNKNNNRRHNSGSVESYAGYASSNQNASVDNGGVGGMVAATTNNMSLFTSTFQSTSSSEVPLAAGRLTYLSGEGLARHDTNVPADGGFAHSEGGHLRHHHSSRHHHSHHHHSNHRSSSLVSVNSVNVVPGQQQHLHRPSPPLAGVGAQFLNGIPSAVNGPRHLVPVFNHELRLRLPPSDEQAVLQRVPRTHATVVASHDLPPPPTSSDAWSSTSNGSSTRSRGRQHHRSTTSTHHRVTSSRSHHHVASTKKSSSGQPMVASVRLEKGSTVDSIGRSSPHTESLSDVLSTAKKPQAAAMQVTMEDPILRKKINLNKQQHKPPSASSEGALKRKRDRDDSSDGTKSDDGAMGSGSDEGYAASNERNSCSGSDEGYANSLERQSAGSGGDSMSSDDDNKEKLASPSARNGDEMVGMTLASQSNSKRTETSSMSSSVLADFSSVMNDNSLTRSDSPRSECTSISSKGESNSDGAVALNNKGDVKHEGDHPSFPALLTTNKTRKRLKSKSESPYHPSKPSPDSAELGAPNDAMTSGLSIMEKLLHQKVQSANHHYHSRSTGRKMLEKSFLSAKRDLTTADNLSSKMMAKQGGKILEGKVMDSNEEANIYLLGHDVMAQVASFLEPPEAYSFLTTPLSKTWLVAYTAPQELWKILCTSAPFYAKLDYENGGGSSDSSSCSSFPMCNDMEMRHLFGRYRLLYTSFVRCMKYLNRLQDDALNGRVPALYANASQADIYPYNKNTSLKAYFAKARRLARSGRHNSNNDGSRSSSSDAATRSDAALSFTTESGSLGSGEKAAQAGAASAALANESSQQDNPSQVKSSTRRLAGRSMLTDRLLRPTQAGEVDNVNLPWTCAIYSVVNWMVAFADVEGIQIMCLKCLPYLLEDESQRTTAQRAGLTDSVLRAMVLFPDSIELHTVAFHTLVLLARPLGGNEGMLFHTAMVNTRGIFNNGSSNSKNGIVIMLDSMRRFAHDEILQAMSCWSLVNVALTPLQKSMLVKLGGLTVTSNAMLQHPYNAEVQFRALFALINIVIPTETRPEETEEMRQFEREIFQQLGEVGDTSEIEMLDASVGQISNLVVVAMKNFCSSDAILNRACLVLHNLSLNEGYHSILLWTPNCYQMLEWCLGNFPHDHVLQQSAGGTIQRLNATLAANDDLRARFTHSIRAQQQHSLEIARQEAILLQREQGL